MPDHHELPTLRSMLTSSHVAVLVCCKSRRHQSAADLQRLVEAGRDDVPLIELRWRSANCRSGPTDFVCTSQDATRVRSWEHRPAGLYRRG